MSTSPHRVASDRPCTPLRHFAPFRLARPLLLCLLGALLLQGAACSTIQPWVKHYERDHLAAPIMSWDRDALSGAYLDHVYEAREGSRGGTGVSGGGCGCN